ncbi:MAG: HDIG domain-containing protein [Desulfovibrio sp.]|jgi:poly(A) polymerase|nr:HDIG domain-containing protein [Desulfovibrio sp.]
MQQAFFKDAVTICKSVMRNGFDAHIVNAQMQHDLMVKTGIPEIDLATDAPLEELSKIFPHLQPEGCPGALAVLKENGVLFRFYLMNIEESASPLMSLIRMTPTMLEHMSSLGPLPRSLISGMSSLAPHRAEDACAGFSDTAKTIRLEGLPDETLAGNFLLGIRAFRFAANHNVPIEPNTWMAIVRLAQPILAYVPVREIMEEWRKVEAEKMWKFAHYLLDSQILHGIIPEIAALDCVRQIKNDSGVEESVLEHTLNCVRLYPEGDFQNDWLGSFAMLFHDVGKPHTAEYYQGRWTFYEHHRIGAKITRKILHRLLMLPEEIDLICRLVGNHMRFQFMMTDRGIRRFMAQGEHRRLMGMSRANIRARDDNYTAFNHNMKYLERAKTPEQMLEPLLNGNEIMEVTGLSPGPHVGIIRNDLLQAQISGTVTCREEAIAFALGHAQAGGRNGAPGNYPEGRREMSPPGDVKAGETQKAWPE